MEFEDEQEETTSAQLQASGSIDEEGTKQILYH